MNLKSSTHISIFDATANSSLYSLQANFNQSLLNSQQIFQKSEVQPLIENTKTYNLISRTSSTKYFLVQCKTSTHSSSLCVENICVHFLVIQALLDCTSMCSICDRELCSKIFTSSVSYLSLYYIIIIQ